MLDWHGTGMSVMEMSHRGKEFMSIYAETLAALRELLAIPDGYQVLFLQGGAIGQNAIVPMNLLRGKTRADYVNTGDWAKRSIAEAEHFCRVNVAASGEAERLHRDPAAATSGGSTPRRRTSTSAPTRRSSASSTTGRRTPARCRWSPTCRRTSCRGRSTSARYGLIYAGAQKNIGPAGLTFVIVRDDLLGGALTTTPSAFDYTVQAANDSMINTPPTYAIYLAGLVFAWIKEQGGVAAMAERNQAKAALLYEALDASGFYVNRIVPADRSRMNVTFHLPDPALDAPFLEGARAAGLLKLKGHRVVGGMRASIYNAMPIEGVRALVAYMKEFEARRG